MRCEKCYRYLFDCQTCKGGRIAADGCATCRSTGSVCSAHGGFWKR